MAHWLVLGGTGFVGRALCEALSRPEHADGPRLLVPSRRPAHGQLLRMLPRVDLIETDVHDDAALAGLVAGADAVVNLVAILHGSEAAFERVHVALPRRLAAACRAAGVRRVVHVSAIGATPDAPSRYLRSKARGEAVLREAGLDLTVLRPSVIFGASDRLLNLFASLQRFAPVVPLAGASARFQPVWVGDVAEALARCLEQPGTVGRTFECTGPEEMTLADLVRAAGRYAGHERPVVPLPDALARLQARLMEWAPGEPLMSRDNLDSMRMPNIATPGVPGLPALGITASPLSAVAPGYLAPGQRCGRLDAARAVHR
ncbi:MAG: complex I NDUFA9 subunit family protein [Vitreoscilla sp.]|nr:complex I NDUFA9 subunit family protein [Vitreoscilla sp.]